MKDTGKGAIFYDLRLDPGAVIESMKSYWMNALREAEDKLIERMSEHLRQSHSAKEIWKEEACQSMRAFNEQIVGDMISADVGIEINRSGHDLGRAVMTGLITQYGSGDRATTDGGIGARIYAGPPGRIVFNNEMDGSHPSKAKSQYDLPTGFNMKGNKWLDNAMKDMAKYFSQIMKRAWDAMPDAIFYNNMTVS